MNVIFKKKNKIKLDDKYFLEPDQFKGIVLVFNEKRQKEKIDIKTRKGTGVFEEYMFEDKWYYPKLSMVLNKYLILKQSEATDVKELLTKTKEVENLISKLNK